MRKDGNKLDTLTLYIVGYSMYGYVDVAIVKKQHDALHKYPYLLGILIFF